MKAAIDGVEYQLPAFLALDSTEGSCAAESIDITGAHGEVLVSSPRLRPKSLTASGLIAEATLEESEAVERELTRLLLLQQVKLFPSDDAPYWINCWCKSVSINKNRGKFDGRAINVSLKFEASDPWTYWPEESVEIQAPGIGIEIPAGYFTPATIELTMATASQFSGVLFTLGEEAYTLSTPVDFDVGDKLIITSFSANLNGASILGAVSAESISRELQVGPGTLFSAGPIVTSAIVRYFPRCP